jgi:hypothetical protein
MPPRWMTWAIIAFWAATTVWLVLREVAPRWRAGEPPPYTIDLTDEVGGQPIHWRVLWRGQKLGSAVSWVKRRPDRTFELHTKLDCSKLILFDSIKLRSSYHVDSQGDLLGVRVEGEVVTALGSFKGDLIGQVEEGYIAPELRGWLSGQEHVVRGERVKVPRRLLNSMALLNKISGLSVGQTWSIPQLDPLQFFSLGIKAQTTPRLNAEVTAGTLDWNHEKVPCHIIEYREPGKDKVSVRIWVRQSDGAVLQHAATHDVLELVLQRDPSK